ncbi:MAG: alpha-galactosidase [Lentisphaeria bacterium]
MNHCPDSSQVMPGEMTWIHNWRDGLLGARPGATARLRVRRNGWGTVQPDRSYASLPLCIGGREFAHGLACHADSEIQVQLATPARRFRAWAGLDQNPSTTAAGPVARIVFSVEAGGRELWRSDALTAGMPPVAVDLSLDAAVALTLKAVAVDGNTAFAHTDWAEAEVELADGRVLRLAESLQTPERIVNDLPFSFQVGRRSSAEWLSPARAETATADWQDGRRLHTLAWDDADSGLRCTLELTEFADFPALEWVVRLRNNGRAETAPVHAFKALDIFWKGAQPGGMPELRRAFGSDGCADDFQYRCEELRHSMWDAPHTVRMNTAANNVLRQARNSSPPGLDTDSRTSATWLPFFNLRTGGDGIITALGWTGRWFAEFAHDGNGKTDIAAGMEHLSLQLRPGEEIRSPRVLLMYWSGTPMHAHNLLRQFMLKHHRPAVNGQPAEMPVCNGSWGGTPTPGHLDAIARIAEHGLPYDYYWIDAGWYGVSDKPCPDVFHGDWGFTGNWCVNRNYHPDGLKPISDAARRAGMKFLLWLEPERAKYGTPVTLEHPEWFLRRTHEAPKPHDDMLLNLGHPGARQWVVELISALITENGIDCYREDFNIDPGPFWDLADEGGRQGLTEMRFVEGLYAFWDELRRRHPGLLIDNCASGGRRLDLETADRSVALWRTDYNCFPNLNPDASQLHGAGLNLWLPLNAVSPIARPGDTYQARSAYSAGLVLNVEEFGMGSCLAPDFPWDWFKKTILEAKRLRSLFLGDFYPLTPCVLDPAGWMACQLLLPDAQEGAVLAFRRAESPLTAASFQLRGLRAGSSYEFTDADSGKTWQATGKELMEKGLPVTADAPRTSRLLFFRRVKT